MRAGALRIIGALAATYAKAYDVTASSAYAAKASERVTRQPHAREGTVVHRAKARAERSASGTERSPRPGVAAQRPGRSPGPACPGRHQAKANVCAAICDRAARRLSNHVARGRRGGDHEYKSATRLAREGVTSAHVAKAFGSSRHRLISRGFRRAAACVSKKGPLCNACCAEGNRRLS